MPAAPPDPRRGTLADGREILYFDDVRSAVADAVVPDRRSLERRPTAGELRHDDLSGEWVVHAPHRQDRTHLPEVADCPLCPTRGDAQTEIPATSYDVVVFENRFPSLPAAPADGGPPAGGRAEVVCYADDHEAQFGSLPPERLRTIAEAWAHRERALAADPATALVFTFENRGEEIGVTLHHPHGQIYAYPFVPPRAARLREVSTAYHARTASCLGCDLLAAEIADGRRIVRSDADAVAYVPVAARWPYEIHVVPRRHTSTLADLTATERFAMVRLQADVLARLDTVFAARVPYMAGWFPKARDADRAAHHLRLEIASPQRDAGKLKYLAGSESLMGVFIGDVVPEVAAQRLRESR
jgi:UDPglucose--hexose-1-phosphate uridylyltransferase